MERLDVRALRGDDPRGSGSRRAAPARVAPRGRWARCVALLLAIGPLAPDVAHGAEPSGAEVARARALFAEGEAAAGAEQWDVAVARFEEVRALKETPGVLFHLAAAHEGAGRVATALGLFERSRDRARSEGVADVLALAGERIAELGHRVPRLVVRAGPGAANVRLDGRPLDGAELGATLRVDPGRHRVEAEERGAPVLREIELGEGALLTVVLGEVPAPTAPPGAPAPAPEGSAAAVAPTSPGERSAGPPLGAWLLAGGGVALGLGGVGAFVAAGSESDAAAEACAAGRCDEGARSTVQALDRVALGLWIGGALAIGGAGLWWALSDDAAVSAAVRPGGGALRARF